MQLSVKQKLNTLKRRSWYRPVAPIFAEEDAPRLCIHPVDNRHFSPFMSYAVRWTEPTAAAVVHLDGTARAQTVKASEEVGLAPTPRLAYTRKSES